MRSDVTTKTALQASPLPLDASAGGSTPHVATDSVAFQYGDGFRFGPVDLRVRRGEMTALLGPNGCGKSTLFRLVAGALKPDRGTILLDGKSVSSQRPNELARRLAVVPQDVVAPPGYTVTDIVSFGRTAHAPRFAGLGSADRQAIARALALTDMDQLAHRSFSTLSGGERQRGLLAMALAQEAPLLLLDEPTAHLDIHYQVETLDVLRDLHRSGGLTMLVTLHDLNLAALYFDRLILLAEGRVVADGSAAEVLRPAILAPVFRNRVRVVRHPAYPVPFVVPAPAQLGDRNWEQLPG